MSHFTTDLTVRTYECDLYGHVNNASFLNYLEYARVGMLEEMGYTLNTLKEIGILLPIIKIEIEYKRPAFPGERLEVTVEWTKRGRTSAVFRQQVIRKQSGKLVADATVTWVATDLRGEPVPIPEELIECFGRKFNTVS